MDSRRLRIWFVAPDFDPGAIPNRFSLAGRLEKWPLLKAEGARLCPSFQPNTVGFRSRTDGAAARATARSNFGARCNKGNCGIFTLRSY